MHNRMTNSKQRARRHAVTGMAERLCSHLAQADQYERHWHRRIAWMARRRNRELVLLDQIQALRQRVLELETQNDELAAFDRSVAHELKNLLSRIIGYAEVLAEGDTVVPGEQRQYGLGVIAQDGRKLNSIVDALLLLCGASAEQPEIESLAMHTIVSRALNRLSPTIASYGAEVILPDTWPIALGYGPWIERVWVNYVSNAIKYGGIPPRVELGANRSSSPPLGAAEREGGKAVRFWVRDNGPGLSPEQQARLFKPFTRLHRAQADGNGLGLSIVRQIVTKLGGQVGVESDSISGLGSVFYFCLPTGK